MINNVVLVGRLTKEPDLSYTSGGNPVATFTLAVNRNFTNQSGKREADFINCVIWRKPAETLAEYCHKGSQIGVVGRIQTRNYENQQGQRVYVTEVICENFQMLDGKSKESQTNNSTSHSDSNDFSKDNQKSNSSNDFPGTSNLDISDDDLPF